MHYTVIETVAPTIEPITIDDVKTLARVLDPKEDSLITNTLIPAARRLGENRISRRFIKATLKMYLDAFPEDAIELPWAPVSAVSEIEYIDGDGVTQTDDDPEGSGDWQIDRDSEPTRILPAYGESWPTTRTVQHAVSVTFDCGYGTAASDVPDELRLAMSQLVGHWRQFRDPQVLGTIQSTAPYMVMVLFDVYQWRFPV